MKLFYYKVFACERHRIMNGTELDLRVNGTELDRITEKQQQGLIINITSACACFAWPGWATYSAAKAGLEMFSRCLYTEVQQDNIAVSVITPGGSNTGFQKDAGIDQMAWDESQALRSEHIAEAVFSIVNMPKGGVVPKMIVYGMAQEIIPF